MVLLKQARVCAPPPSAWPKPVAGRRPAGCREYYLVESGQRVAADGAALAWVLVLSSSRGILVHTSTYQYVLVHTSTY
jgi:hypothetical protein